MGAAAKPFRRSTPKTPQENSRHGISRGLPLWSGLITPPPETRWQNKSPIAVMRFYRMHFFWSHHQTGRSKAERGRDIQIAPSFVPNARLHRQPMPHKKSEIQRK
jgi:hypothetical protein